MEIIVSKSAGFCHGITRAVRTVYEQLENGPLCTYGSIAHNKIVTEDLKRRGVKIIDDFDQVQDETVVIRSHGVPGYIYKELQKRQIPYIDCTCHCVKKIHRLAAQNREEGRRLIILGDSKHPEIIGIKDYAGPDALIIENADALLSHDLSTEQAYALVVQTTFVREEFDRIVTELRRQGLELRVLDTICDATVQRQTEAEALSKKVERMIVIGDRASANTVKLYNICRKNCQNTILIEGIADLMLNYFSADDRIGITAGASTPPTIIKEAITYMSELENTNTQSFEEMLDESFITLHTGDVVKGTVIQVSSGEVSVNLKYKSDGIIPRNEITDDPTVDITQTIKPGDIIDVFVVRVNDGEGNVLLSKKKIDAQKHYEELEEAYQSKTPVPGKIIELVKGGLIALIKGVRIFVPSSQISNRYVENLNTFLGKEFNFHIIEMDRGKRRIVAGRKELSTIEQNELKEKVFSTLEVGQRLQGKVSRIVAFGAFVDLGGVDGLIHISQLSWGRVKKVTDVLAEGDDVTVLVLDVDKEKGKISLSLKDINNDPWNSVNDKYIPGEVVEGKVVRMVPFGAFVELEPGVDGLVHISQIASKHVVRPEDELTIGEIIKVKITDVNSDNKKISLSKKEADGVLQETEEIRADESTDESVISEESVMKDSTEEPTGDE